eukprot:snap_masked-scaffold_1-processed-gene-8.39-mRNA-1 protein AED:1.00 eAED:1.00 QI:0/-1/0/0/-1/1/1/0/138
MRKDIFKVKYAVKSTGRKWTTDNEVKLIEVYDQCFTVQGHGVVQFGLLKDMVVNIRNSNLKVELHHESYNNGKLDLGFACESPESAILLCETLEQNFQKTRLDISNIKITDEEIASILMLPGFEKVVDRVSKVLNKSF